VKQLFQPWWVLKAPQSSAEHHDYLAPKQGGATKEEVGEGCSTALTKLVLPGNPVLLLMGLAGWERVETLGWGVKFRLGLNTLLVAMTGASGSVLIPGDTFPSS
jgi:hypothetical protein